MRDYNFGELLQGLRSEAGLTQYRLGKLIGVSDKAVSKWENGSSMPRIDMLHKISEVFGIGIDELISHKYDPVEKDGEGMFAAKDKLWDEVLRVMHQRYGKDLPVGIYNRFLSERDELINTDMIVYYGFLATLSVKARKLCEHIRIKGGTGSSFIAYLSGATKTNPLPPHYYCQKCGAVIFDNSAKNGWDLPEKRCMCGTVMTSDGHNIPFASCRTETLGKTSLNVSVSPEFLSQAVLSVKEYFKDCRLTCKEFDEERIRITVRSGASSRNILLCADDELTRCKTLEKVTNTRFERVEFRSAKILQEFKRLNTDGITEFKVKFVKDMMNKAAVSSFYGLLQILGLSHSLGMWRDNGEKLTEQGVPIEDLIAYRDDVFNYIGERMIESSFADTGFAYKVTDDARRGYYAECGVPYDVKTMLCSVGAEERFTESVGKAKYLFHKAHGVEYLRSALILMWYKVNFPKEFNEIMM